MKAIKVYLRASWQKALRVLLEQGYAESGPEAKRLEQEFSRLDAESLKHAD